jgi:hypothetical protein
MWPTRAGQWRVLASSTTGVVVAAGVLITGIALIDRRVNLSFGLLCLFPIILVGTVLKRWQVVVVASLCTWLTEAVSQDRSPHPQSARADRPRTVACHHTMRRPGSGDALRRARGRRIGDIWPTDESTA